ncbi:unnamed protein product, partial [Didymodactylos carnosus]
VFTEKPFYNEAVHLMKGYKPIVEQLVEPLQPLKIDTSNKFNTLSLLGAQLQIPVRGAQRSGILFCYATRDSLDEDWHVDRLEFKSNSQPNRYLFYDRSLRRVPLPSDIELAEYTKKLAAGQSLDVKKLSEPSKAPVVPLQAATK